MSLLRKIRRQHKAFVLRRSAQINGSDKAPSVSSVDIGKDGDEDDNANSSVKSLQQANVQNVHVSIAACPRHETHQMPSLCKSYSVHKDVSAQSLIYIPTGVITDEDPDMNFAGKESRFWPRVMKTAAFLLVTAGAFFVGKLAAVGLTLTVALACKLLGRGPCESLISAETGECYQSPESLQSSSELVRLNSKAELSCESKIPFVCPLGNLAMDANGHSQMDMEAIGHDQSEETLSIKVNGNTLLPQRKQLKRLNRIKLPPSASPLIEAMDDSPSSSAKASPRMWFHDAGSSMATVKGIIASSAEINKEAKFKSKVLLRNLRKGEPQSARSCPSRTSQEASHSFCLASHGRDTETRSHPAVPMHRKSKFSSASPAEKEASRADANVSTSLQKGEMKVFKETMSPDISCFQEGEEKPSVFTPATPTSREARTDIQAPSETHELPHKRRGGHQCAWKPVTSVSQDTITANVSAIQDLLQCFVQNGGRKKQQQVRVGSSWIAFGLVITIAGLFMGRTVAIAGLVCYWYALSLKSKKASGRRR